MSIGQQKTAAAGLNFPLLTDGPQRGTHALSLLTTYIVLVTFIPLTIVLAAFGGAGSPATLFAAVLLGWYLLLWVHPGYPLFRAWQPARGAVAVFAGTIVAAYVSANRHPLSSTMQNGADRGLVFLAGWLAVLLLAADGVERWDQLRRLVGRLVCCVSVIAGIGIAQFFLGLRLDKISIPGFIVQRPIVDLMNRAGLARPAATTAHPLEFAAVLAMTLPLALHQARHATAGSRLRCWLQVALITAALPLTVSRSAVLSLAVIALVLLPTWPRRHRRRAYMCIAGLAAAAWAVLPSLVTLLLQLFTQIGAESSSTSRLDAYSSAVPLFTQHPWLGRGFQTFLPQVYFFVDNQYLTSLIETGALGVLALIALFVVSWCLLRSARRVVPDERTRDLLQSLAASVLIAGLSFATFDVLSFATASGLSFLIMGCSATAWRLVRSGAREGRW